MIPDCETNLVYFSHLLASRYVNLTEEITAILKKAGIPVRSIPGTRDIWCRDYMPVQVDLGEFAQFRYDPDYLRGKKDREKSKTPPDVAKAIPEIKHLKQSSVVLDGGNVVHSKDKVFLTDKVLRENRSYTKEALFGEVRALLGTEHVVIIRKEPYDLFGHSDGVLRFVNERLVVVQDYSKVSPWYRKHLLGRLRVEKIEFIELPYAPKEETTKKGVPSASGCYANFLQVRGLLIVPVYGIPEDQMALKVLRKAFSFAEVIPLKCQDLAAEGGGGMLNCVSWSIKA